MSDSTLDCPCCSSPMRPLMHDRVRVDFCSGCGGTWYDAGELEQALGEQLTFVGAAATYRSCPHCRKAMKRVLVGKIGVERCESCEGMFLDGGEFESIVGAQRAEAARRAAQEAPAKEQVALPSTFVCQKCGKKYAREKGYAVPGGYVCDGCSGLVALLPKSRFERFLDELVRSIPATRSSYGRYRP